MLTPIMKTAGQRTASAENSTPSAAAAFFRYSATCTSCCAATSVHRAPGRAAASARNAGALRPSRCLSSAPCAGQGVLSLLDTEAYHQQCKESLEIGKRTCALNFFKRRSGT